MQASGSRWRPTNDVCAPCGLGVRSLVKATHGEAGLGGPWGVQCSCHEQRMGPSGRGVGLPDAMACWTAHLGASQDTGRWCVWPRDGLPERSGIGWQHSSSAGRGGEAGTAAWTDALRFLLGRSAEPVRAAATMPWEGPDASIPKDPAQYNPEDKYADPGAIVKGGQRAARGRARVHSYGAALCGWRGDRSSDLQLCLPAASGVQCCTSSIARR